MGSTLLIVFVRYELRVRYLPRSFQELYSRDKVTFYYLYDQVGESMRERVSKAFHNRPLTQDLSVYDFVSVYRAPSQPFFQPVA